MSCVCCFGCVCVLLCVCAASVVCVSLFTTPCILHIKSPTQQETDTYTHSQKTNTDTDKRINTDTNASTHRDLHVDTHTSAHAQTHKEPSNDLAIRIVSYLYLCVLPFWCGICVIALSLSFSLRFCNSKEET